MVNVGRFQSSVGHYVLNKVSPGLKIPKDGLGQGIDDDQMVIFK